MYHIVYRQREETHGFGKFKVQDVQVFFETFRRARLDDWHLGLFFLRFVF